MAKGWLMFKLLFKILTIFLIITNIYASNIEVLNNNIRTNIDKLCVQLKYLIPKNKDTSNEISNLLNIYYQHYEKIQGFEILYKDEYIYSSNKNESTIIILKNEVLPTKIKNTPEIYSKDIFDNQNKYLGKLIVYFKNEIDFTQEELNYLKDKRVLRVQNDSNLAPYNFNENGIAKGFSIDYINLIANKLALQVEYIQGNWDDFLNMLENNQLDMMLNVLKSKEREERFLFSDISYLLATPAMITRIAERDYHSFSEIDGKTIALVKGYHSYDRVKKDYPNVAIYPTNNVLEMIQAVSNKKADVAYALRDVLEYNINKHLITNLNVSNNIDDEKFGFYFTYNKNNTILKNIIHKAEKLISKTELEELQLKWFNKIALTQANGRNYLFSKDEIDYLAKKRSISICVDPDFLPYEQITKEGNYVGIVSDIISQLSQNTNIKFDLNITKSFKESFELVKNKKCDILPFAAQTINRESFFNFTQPYLKFPIVIATRDSEFFINSLKEIKNERIGMIKNYALIEIAKYKYPNINIVEVKDTKEGLEKVNKNQIYAFVGSLPSITYSRQRNNIQDIRITGKISENMLARIAIRNDEPILLSILNKAINSLKEEEKERITNKWVTIVKEKQFNTKLFIQIISLIIVIFIFIVIFLVYRSNIKLSALNKELEKLSQTDKLTSIYNRAKLDSILEDEMKLFKRYKESTSLIIADIDFFKDINDTYGHTTGDIILKEFSQVLSKNIRETDSIGRWGGEEFLIILPRIKENNAIITAENLRIAVENFKFHDNIKVTASFGVYECKESNPTKCLSKADKALYLAKNSNRNCVRAYSEIK
jgi:polar amino acid transport system substrate-binding protein